MKIQQIRNATLKIKYGDQTILLDPWLQDKETGFSADVVRVEMAGIRNPMNDLPTTPQEILSGVDFCLVTHVHPDHFTPDYLPKEIRIVVQNKEDQHEIESLGFRNVIAFKGNTLNFGSITVTKVPAVHGDNEVVAEMMGCVSGYILNGESKKLYIAGDTVYCRTVEETLDQYQPDVIAVNCCEATMPSGRLIMNCSDLKAVCAKVPKALVVATHLDSVNHALLTSDDIRMFAKTQGLTQICVPGNGDSIEEMKT